MTGVVHGAVGAGRVTASIRVTTAALPRWRALSVHAIAPAPEAAIATTGAAGPALRSESVCGVPQAAVPVLNEAVITENRDRLFGALSVHAAVRSHCASAPRTGLCS